MKNWVFLNLIDNYLNLLNSTEENLADVVSDEQTQHATGDLEHKKGIAELSLVGGPEDS